MKEIHKLVFSGHGVWYITVVLFVAIYFSGNGYMTYTDTEILKDEMYLEHGGKDKEYIREYTNEKLTDLKNATGKTDIMTQMESISMQECVLDTFRNLQINWNIWME